MAIASAIPPMAVLDGRTVLIQCTLLWVSRCYSKIGIIPWFLVRLHNLTLLQLIYH